MNNKKYLEAMQRLNELKTEVPDDCVQVVRCKDCKHYMADTGLSPDFIAYYCSQHNYDYSVDDNDFCSYGERKAD